MSSNHLNLCHPFLLLPSVFPSIWVFSNESALPIRWPKYWSFSFSPFSEYSGLISFRIDQLDLLAVQRTLKSLLRHHNSKTSVLQHWAFFMVQLLHLFMTTGKTIALTLWTFVGKVMSPLHRGSEASKTTKRDKPHQPLWLAFYRCMGPGGPQGNRRQAVPTSSGSTANIAFSLHAATSTGHRSDGRGRMCMHTWAAPFSFTE